ncbi:MAG: proton glutamate symport protein [Polaribacter sp.]|jgi:proton glutamate symport protein
MSIHWKVLIGIISGLIIGYVASFSEMGVTLIQDFVKPFGTIFIRVLKLIAVPLVFVSLAKGITELKDIRRLSNLGGKTIFWYLCTTVMAVVLGLLLVNIFQPGAGLDIEALQTLSKDTVDFSSKTTKGDGPLDFFVQMVPDNIFAALSDNGRLLQVIFFTVLFSVALLMIPDEDQPPVVKLIESLNKVMLKIVDLIIAFSPYAVFALMATLIVEIKDPALFKALLNYSLTLLFGMLVLLIIYPLMAKFFAGMPIQKFAKGIIPAQLVALTTSSSMATLPVTMECVIDNLGVDDEIVSFVCPIGATVNMDGTSLMQSIAAVFVCQIIGLELSITDQLVIVVTATMASIGAAAAPSAGIVMLVMVLESVGFPSDKLPLALTMILAVDRPLDMARTVVNISGDSFVCVVVGKK